jgi:preprotein translocase subunit SecY
MKTAWKKVRLFFSDRTLVYKLLGVLGMLIAFRILSVIPIPGVDSFALAQYFESNQLLGFFNIFSGGGLSQLSIIMLGVGPYITASIIMQLLTIMVPRLKELYHEEGEAGRKIFNSYSRFATIPIALIQGAGLLTVLSRQGVILMNGPFDFAANLILITAGALVTMWLGEIITEFGFGNGVSIIIFAGIVAILPVQIAQIAFSLTPSDIPLYVLLAILLVGMVFAVVMITEAERPIPVTYAKQVRGGTVYGGTSTYIPLRVNQAGVMPIIFALSLLTIPQLIGQFLATNDAGWAQAISNGMLWFVQNLWVYGIAYFVLVVVFTFFYTAITFEPDTLATNLQKNGAFVPGVRPGQPTASYVAETLNRITFVGALFLGLIAVLPLILQSLTGNQAFAIGGTALLIVVSVALDVVRRINAELSVRDYD